MSVLAVPSLRRTLIVEAVHVDVAAGSLGGIAEDAELAAHEEAAVVEHAAVALGAYLLPPLAVEAVVEVGGIVVARLEVGRDSQVEVRGER